MNSFHALRSFARFEDCYVRPVPAALSQSFCLRKALLLCLTDYGGGEGGGAAQVGEGGGRKEVVALKFYWCIARSI